MSGPPRSPYDSATPEEELWFLPGPPGDEDPGTGPLAGPRAGLGDPRAWQRAEAGLGRELAEAAAALARLDEALLRLPGALTRLALAEAAGLGWGSGVRLEPGRLALFAARRLSASDPDFPALARADWARRRLLSDRDPMRPGAFLGRGRPFPEPGRPLPEPGGRGGGSGEFSLLERKWTACLKRAELHPISRAGFGFHLWRGLGASGDEDITEPALLAARLGARGLNSLPFLPLAATGTAALTGGGTVPERLRRWLAGATRSSRAARLELERLLAWQDRARTATGPRSGRVPRALIGVFLRAPVVSAISACRETGASRAAIQRNLTLFEDLGLIREITGQSRYRFWRAAS